MAVELLPCRFDESLKIAVMVESAIESIDLQTGSRRWKIEVQACSQSSRGKSSSFVQKSASVNGSPLDLTTP